MKQQFAFIDTETTGLQPYTHEVISVAVVYEKDENAGWLSRVMPTRMEAASPQAMEINKLVPSSWIDAPTPMDVALKVQSSLKGKTVVGHNVTFDLDFLSALCVESKVSSRGSYEDVLGIDGFIDTVSLVREHLFPLGLTSASLDSVREFLGWSMEGAHTARKDAEDVRRLFFLLERMNLLERQGVKRKVKIALSKRISEAKDAQSTH